MANRIERGKALLLAEQMMRDAMARAYGPLVTLEYLDSTTCIPAKDEVCERRTIGHVVFTTCISYPGVYGEHIKIVCGINKGKSCDRWHPEYVLIGRQSDANPDCKNHAFEYCHHDGPHQTISYLHYHNFYMVKTA